MWLGSLISRSSARAAVCVGAVSVDGPRSPIHFFQAFFWASKPDALSFPLLQDAVFSINDVIHGKYVSLYLIFLGLGFSGLEEFGGSIFENGRFGRTRKQFGSSDRVHHRFRHPVSPQIPRTPHQGINKVVVGSGGGPGIILSGTLSETELKLRAEIRELLKEASAYSQPSTFAQAAKLRRIAAAKEKELAKIQEVQMKEKKSFCDPYMKAMMPIKILTYFVLAIWFWGSPVAAISKELVQPFGKVLSWKAGGFADDKVMLRSRGWDLAVDDTLNQSQQAYLSKSHPVERSQCD
ncbi:GET1-like protein [Drosera capensis]